MSRSQKRSGKTPGRTPSRNGALQRSDSSTSSGELDPVEVYCRIRPYDAGEKCVQMIDDTTVEVASSDAKVLGVMQYKFTKVFGETTSQKHLFDCVGAPLIDDLIRAKNGLLFTYGITSSGKTYTMTGDGQDPGILPRCLDMVFNSIKGVQATKYVFMPDRQNGFNVQSEADAMYERQQREVLPGKGKQREKMTDFSDRQKDPSIVLDIDKDGNYAVFVSFVEIYNNHIFDLLEDLPYDPITGTKAPQGKTLREDSSRVMFVYNVTETEVKSTEEAFDVLAKGQKRRKVAHTALNAESSRSHSVFTIRLVQAPLDTDLKEVLLDKSRVVVSQLSLVDLAGSERTNRTKSSGERLKEAGQINQSLMALRQCIDVLRENQRTSGNKIVPYRDSKVTHLFKNFFDGEGKVRMVVCVNPKAVEYDETLHVMRFSEATQEVQVHRAQEKPKFSDEQYHTRARRRLAPHSSAEQLAPAAKKPSLESLPHAPVPLTDIYTLPVFPSLTVEPRDESNADLQVMDDYLQNLMRVKQKHLDSVMRKQDSFRQYLVEMDKEMVRLRTQAGQLLHDVQERDALIIDQNQEAERIGSRLQVAEKENCMLRQKMTLYQHEKQQLANELQDKDWKLHKTDYEKEKLRSEYEQQVAQAEQEYEAQLAKEKHKIHQQAQENLTVKERKLQLLKSIMNQSDVESLGGDVAKSTTSSQRGARTRPAVPYIPNYATPTTSSKGRKLPGSAIKTTARATGRPATRQRARSPPPTSLKPNPVRNHRRSKSAGDRWLEHKPEPLLPLDTVLQPKMKKKKSVGRLEVKDTNKASRYILTTQDADNKGNVETKLVKGDVKVSAGGGSSVVFTEVETLKQTSPGDRKRQYLPEGRSDYEGEWTDTEERCNTAIEGHGVYRRIRQFDKNAGALV
ncbi:kinesin-like protein KIF23 [Watersipora subatra]|uniref:kinesin-like protein KIF23 n=1 Tax=Watersipora subatra TaxID=2589382 RepID=UPI00355B30AF